MKSLDRNKIKKMLNNIKSTPESIIGTCDYFLKYGKMSNQNRDQLVQIWKDIFKKHYEEKNVTRMTSMVYVLNDIVQKCKYRKQDIYMEEIKIDLIKIIVDYGRKGNIPKYVKSITNLLRL